MQIPKIIVPPLKIQGKKTLLLPFIRSHLPDFEVWVEPFMGSGAVGFNVRPKKAIFADINPHIISFYSAVKSGEITAFSAKTFLTEQGKLLAEGGEGYYKKVRERFNESCNPLDFLFLNRSCFNGMMRFNRHGKFNVPFGHKPQRFSKAYVTKIVNQIKHTERLIRENEWTFVCQDFSDTLKSPPSGAFVYCDPPYIGRHTDYYDGWNEEKESRFSATLLNGTVAFMVSSWYENKYRKNEFLEKYWSRARLYTTEHFYHLGAKEKHRNAVTEALLLNYAPKTAEIPQEPAGQLYLF